LNSNHDWPATWGEKELLIKDYEDILLDAEFVLKYKEDYARHVAEQASRPRDATSLAEEVPESWELGKHIQRCPTCLKGSSLKDACNHMKCPIPCETHYCYICGVEVGVEERRSHWKQGGCPKYGHPDDPNPKYDTEGEEGADGGVDEDEGAINLMLDWYNFVPYAWNMAMQTTDEATRTIMRNILSRGEHFRLNLETGDNINRVVSAMTQYHQQSGVSRVDWTRIVLHRTVGAHMFFALTGAEGGLMDEVLPPFGGFSISSGMLNRPVGGVFNMASNAGRREAYAWGAARGVAWRNMSTRQRDSENYAVFHMGPASDPIDRCT
jgi:hypothetical protein